MTAAPSPRPPVIALHDAVLGYGDTAVTKPVSLAIRPGDVLAILGPNGSGKSTIVKGILGLARLFGGRIELFGSADPDRRARRRVGYVPQRLHSAGGLPVTVAETVAAGLVPTSHLLRPRAAQRRHSVAVALTQLGLADAANRPLAELSGGQQRRVLIARALVGHPDVLIMDEPLAGVDRANQEQLSATVAGLNNTGLTVILVLHELGPMRPLIPRVVALDDGAVYYDGPPRPTDVHYDDFADHEHDSAPRRTRTGLPGTWRGPHR